MKFDNRTVTIRKPTDNNSVTNRAYAHTIEQHSRIEGTHCERWWKSAVRITATILCWWAWSTVGIAAWAYYQFPSEKGCMIEYVRSWEPSGIVYSVPNKGTFATHVEPLSNEQPATHEFIPIGTVDGCAYQTGYLLIDFPNTVFCGVSKTLDGRVETRR